MHPFGSFCWEFIVWSTITDIQAIYIYIYARVLKTRSNLAAKSKVQLLPLYYNISPTDINYTSSLHLNRISHA